MESELRTKFEEIKSDIAELKIEQAASRPVEDIVKYLLYFWLTLSVVLGLFGWSQLSDIDEEIDMAVARHLPEESKKYSDYETLINQTQQLENQFIALTKSYKERVEDLKYADVVSSNFDISGQVINIVLESDLPGKHLDQGWRVKAITTLQKLKDEMAKKSFPADFVFNAAQVARQLKQFQLAEEMTEAAYKKNPSPPIRALMLSSEVSNSVGEKRNSAYQGLMTMVANLNAEKSPHIVLAEAWNASEESRTYGPLLAAIEERINDKNAGYVPSYLYAIKAQVLLRRSWEGDKKTAADALSDGFNVFKSESSQAQWHESFGREFRKLNVIANSEASLEEIGEDRGQPGMGQLLQLLESLSESSPEIE